MIEGGPIIISGKELTDKGFVANSEYYLVFTIEDVNPVVEFINEKGQILKLKTSPIPYNKEAKFMTIKELFE